MSDDKNRLATNSVHQMRIPQFLPVNQVRDRDGKTEWNFKSRAGAVRISNHRLTQEHRNIIDVIKTYYEPHFFNDGSCQFYFTFYDLQLKLNKASTTNNEWVRKKFDELQSVQFKVTPNDHPTIKTATFSILNSHKEYKKELGQTGKPKHSITFNADYIEFFALDLWVHTEQLTSKIIELDCPGSQALVRHCLSHRKKNESLNGLLREIGAINSVLPRATVARIRKSILAQRSTLEKEFGIILNSELPGYSENNPLVTYEQHSKVWFEKFKS